MIRKLLELLSLKKIRGKFFMLTTILIMIPMFILSMSVYYISSSKLVENAEAQAVSSLMMGEHYMDRVIVDLNDLTNVILGNAQMQEILFNATDDDYEYLRNLEDVRDIMATITQTKPYITAYVIYNIHAKPDKRLFINTGAGQSSYLSQEEASVWYEDLLNSGSIVWKYNEPLEQSNVIKGNSLIVGKLLKKTEGDYGDLGFMLLEIDKSAFFQGLNFLNPDQESQFFIVNKQWEFIYQLPGTYQSQETYINELISELPQSLHNQNHEFMFKGKKYIAAVVTNKKTGWHMINMVEASKLYQDATIIRTITIFMFLLMLFVGWLLAFWLSNSITRPLQRLSVLIKVNAGYSQAAPTYFDSSDEVGQIGHRFLRMMEENRVLHEKVYNALLKRKEAEIQALQAQINPHFLYNTLESLNWLAISRNQFEISEVVGSLGKFFRIAISKGSDMIMVSEELDHVKAYVKVQKFRYKDKFDLVVEFEDDLLSYYMPKFILQPIVENSIYHGIKLKEGPGTIMISGGLYEGDIVFHITDDGLGIPEDRLGEIVMSLESEEIGKSYGLINIHDRLKLRFGAKYGLRITSEFGKFTTVTVTMPLVPVPEEGFIK